MGAEEELADVDRGEAAGDALQHDVQAVALGQHRVDERRADVEAAAARLEHPLDQLGHLRGVEAEVGQLVTPPAGDEDALGRVDPDLLDLRVVEERLQRPEAGDAGQELAHHGVAVGHGRDGAGQAELVVVADDVLGDAAYGEGLALRVDPVAPHPLADLVVEAAHEVVVARPVRGRTVGKAVDGHDRCTHFPRSCTREVTRGPPGQTRPSGELVDNPGSRAPAGVVQCRNAAGSTV